MYHIYPSGEVKCRTANEEYITLKNSAIDIGTFKKEAIFTDEDDKLYTFKDGKIVKVEYIDSITKGKCIHDYVSGEKRYFDYNDNCFMIEYSSGDKKLKCSDESEYVLKADGTYITDNEYGTYTIEKDGRIVFKKNDGSQIICNSTGEKIRYIDKSGNIYDYITDTQIVTKNGKKTYSKINHIEYDEEAYNTILKSFNGIGESYKGTIKSACSDIESAINSFPDSYSASGVSSIGSNIDGHIDLISSLAEMTNYSLLAYQTCDDTLKEGLYLLIDSLFGENETNLANRFKNAISNTIEDKDGDSILEYSENTNFKVLSENAIVDSTYIDDNNNIWYLNKHNIVIGVEGNDLKINYGGEEFSVSYNQNGVIKLRDSNGNPLNIFGDYNINSEQYGGNQSSLKYSAREFWSDESVRKVLDKYFPNATTEETIALFDKLASVGCGFTAIGNIIHKKFEGQEENFYNTFGYPMYNVKMVNGNLSIDYNYEPVILDCFCQINARESVGETVQYALGLHDTYRTNIENYLNTTYNVQLTDLPESIAYRSEWGYSLYNMNGTICLPDGGPHAMVETGKIDDGKYIVSSWGKKLILDCTDDTYRAYYSESGYKRYN